MVLIKFCGLCLFVFRSFFFCFISTLMNTALFDLIFNCNLTKEVVHTTLLTKTPSSSTYQSLIDKIFRKIYKEQWNHILQQGLVKEYRNKIRFRIPPKLIVMNIMNRWSNIFLTETCFNICTMPNVHHNYSSMLFKA